jgi:hypothetical protein
MVTSVYWALLVPDAFNTAYGSTARVDLGRFFSFLMYTKWVGLLGLGISPPQGRYLHTKQHKQNKCTQTSMSRVGLEPTIPVFERTKTVHDLDSAATVITAFSNTSNKYQNNVRMNQYVLQ